jgi:hypothetical protein
MRPRLFARKRRPTSATSTAATNPFPGVTTCGAGATMVSGAARAAVAAPGPSDQVTTVSLEFADGQRVQLDPDDPRLASFAAAAAAVRASAPLVSRQD